MFVIVIGLVKMSMFALIYGVLFSLHFFPYECDGKSLHCYGHLLYGSAEHGVRFTFCRLYCLVHHFETYNNS